ncbi:MAG: DNA polymerase III subunit alpha, partial [Eubacteriales bacterium]
LYLPVFRTPDGSDAAAFLHTITMEGFEAKIADGSIVFSPEHPEEEYRERIAYEWRVICEMGYAEYYLIVWDFIRYAKSAEIPVGPGRGSGAGSLIAYLIGITDVDSIRYSLMFERFLNPERVSMPDFDIDFCDTRRGEVIDYVKRRYGEDHVAQIVTFGTLAARAAVRDVGRALGMSYAETDSIAKAIPQDLHITLDKALEQKELKERYDSDAKVRTLIDTARALEGMPRHASTHAAGVVITDRPVYDYVPLAENSGMVVTQFDMDTVAALGLLKIDFLGLRYLTIIADTEAQIRERDHGFRTDAIPFDDGETYAMIGQGKTIGVFQLESAGMRSMLTQLEPDNLEMIVAAISLYRPGPMDSIPKFLSNRRHPEQIRYPTPLLADILDVTFGCIVYQEQVMQICRSIAGYSYARADLVRRAMAKKKTDVMEKERQAFIYGQRDENGNVVNTGAIAAGMTEEAAGELFDDMASFAKYAFNKSHASAYAFTSYRTAYLKRHYPGEYFSALLTSVNGSLNKTAEYIAEAQRMHISILAPDINESAKYFHVVEKDGRQCIRFGLLAVKNVGVQFVEHIIKEREKRPFADFEDFVARMAEAQDCPKRPIEAFIKCGAFDSIAKKRSQLYASYETIIDQYTDRMRTAVTGQLDLFSAFSEESADAAGKKPVRGSGFRYPDIPEFSGREKLLLERDATGQCFSGHLLDDYMQHLEQLNPTEIGDILAAFETEGDNDAGTPGTGIPMGDHSVGGNGSSGMFSDKQQVAIAGVVSKRVSKLTKKGDTMAFVTVEDRYAEMEVIVFPKVLESAAPYLAYDTAIFVVGELSVREEEAPKLLARTVFPLRTNDMMRTDDATRDDAAAAPLSDGSESGDAPPLHTPASAAWSRADTSENGSGRGNIYGARNAAASKPASPTPIPADAKTLFLRVPRAAEDDDTFRHAKNLAEIFVYDERNREMPGIRAAVVFYDEAEKQYRKQLTAPIALTPYVLLQFEELLGRENAILR